MVSQEAIRPFLKTTLEETNFLGLGERYKGKVRDVYIQTEKHRRILVTTDRQSAFDILWCSIPLKGQVLNQLSLWWFERVKDVIPTHIISVPDPSVAVVKDLKMFPVEIVVRGYLAGSTKTSAWMNYKAGVRDFCGVKLPDGMRKHEKFASTIITPTTKGEEDEMVTPKEILERKLTTKNEWEDISERALALFKRGQELAAKRGLILVDTKYEMGLDQNGVITIGDEVHTPDSSRYWIAATYEERMKKGEDPESLDKEFFRVWLRSQGFEYGGKKPEITDDVRVMLAQKYIELYERVTGEKFTLPNDPNTAARIEKNLAPFRL